MEEKEISSLETHKLSEYLKAKDAKMKREGPLFPFLTIKIPEEMKMSMTFLCLFEFCATKSDQRGDFVDKRYYTFIFLISRYKIRGQENIFVEKWLLDSSFDFPSKRGEDYYPQV